ncbi:MAG: hypothetical protein EPN21_10695 [Methylococcaceae bacterium]|nr:MAG: hypothetical protein EPN21_10695 [Methylococcaceae bacterium]
MSGPTTAFIIADPVSVLLTAAGIRAANAVQAGYAQSAALRAGHEADREARRAAQTAAGEQGLAAMRQAAQAAESELAQITLLAERLGVAEQIQATRPPPPASEDETALAAYVRGLQTLSGELKSVLYTEAARHMDAGDDALFELALPVAAPAAPATAQRLLTRIAHLGPVPEDMAGLALEIAGAASLERAELLTTELRKRVQTRLETEQNRQAREATALVLEQSLKDLGYQVEAIAATLFVEGGVVHFRRQGWGDYRVRLRVDARAGSANFNVIRAVDEQSNERSVLDHIAEDRWCSEFPALQQALAARGVALNVTRRLAAGELPVQQVRRDKLPRFADEEAATPAAKMRAREH